MVCAASCIYIILFRPQIIKKGYNNNAYVLMTNSRFKLNELFLGWDQTYKSHAFQISDRWKISKFRSDLIWNAVNFVKLSRIWVKNFNSGAFQIARSELFRNFTNTHKFYISLRLTQWLMHCCRSVEYFYITSYHKHFTPKNQGFNRLLIDCQ